MDYRSEILNNKTPLERALDTEIINRVQQMDVEDLLTLKSIQSTENSAIESHIAEVETAIINAKSTLQSALAFKEYGYNNIIAVDQINQIE